MSTHYLSPWIEETQTSRTRPNITISITPLLPQTREVLQYHTQFIQMISIKH